MGHANTSNTGTSKLSTEDVRSLSLKINRARFLKLQRHAATKNMSVSGFAKKLIEDYIDRNVIPFEGS